MLRHLGVALVLAGCGAREDIGFVGQDFADYRDCGAPEGPCLTRSCAPPKLKGDHVPMCSHIDFASNPPTSGPHYPVWAEFKEYDKPLPRGFYLHDEEHSAVVLLYNCRLLAAEGLSCQGVLAQMRQAVADTPADPLCEPPTRNRVMIVPDPLLDVPVAAAAWGYSLKGRCFDGELTRAFIAAHYGMNYENFCTGGIDPTDPMNGVPADCGQ